MSETYYERQDLEDFTNIGEYVGSLIMAIITSQSRMAVLWISLFLIATVIFAFNETYIAAVNPIVPDSFSNLLFTMNFGFGLTYMVSNSFYFMYLLEVARKQADDLLLNILPGPIAQRLKEGEVTIADSYESASIMFVDIVNFTPISAASTPKEMISLFTELFSHLDQLVDKHHAEKIETVGDSYMVAVGLPIPREDHAQVIACREAVPGGLQLHLTDEARPCSGPGTPKSTLSRASRRLRRPSA